MLYRREPMRTLWVWLVIVGCNDKKPEALAAPAPAPVRADAAPSDAAPALPREFPAKGAAKAAGTLSDVPFSLAKAHLRLGGNQASLNLYGWVEGEACDPQFAPAPNQLYVSFDFPAAKAVNGAVVRDGDDHVVATYKRPTLDLVKGATATLVLDEVTGAHAAGRILVTDPKGTHVAGSFNAVVCADPQTAAATTTPPVVNGVTWGTEPELAALPAKPASLILLGKTGVPAAVELIDWQVDNLGQHEIHFYETKPKTPCAPELIERGFKIGLPAFKPGATSRGKVNTLNPGQPLAAAVWKSPGNVIETASDAWMAVSIQAVTANEVRGRVVAWFNDPAKSMIAGAFTATNCHVKP